MFMQPGTRSEDHRMRAFPVVLPSGARYWTVLDEDLAVVPVADGFLRQVRFGRDGAESTTKSYAHSPGVPHNWQNRSAQPSMLVGVLLSPR
jgi:integrase/recombinase XerD